MGHGFTQIRTEHGMSSVSICVHLWLNFFLFSVSSAPLWPAGVSAELCQLTYLIPLSRPVPEPLLGSGESDRTASGGGGGAEPFALKGDESFTGISTIALGLGTILPATCTPSAW